MSYRTGPSKGKGYHDVTTIIHLLQRLCPKESPPFPLSLFLSPSSPIPSLSALLWNLPEDSVSSQNPDRCPVEWAPLAAAARLGSRLPAWAPGPCGVCQQPRRFLTQNGRVLAVGDCLCPSGKWSM